MGSKIEYPHGRANPEYPKAECPNCGYEIEKPVKTWTMDRQKKSGESWTTEIRQFKCPKCGKAFRKGKRIK